MSDARLRQAQRESATGDPESMARFYRARVHAGVLNEDHVILAASLGDPAALVLCPNVASVNWRKRISHAIQAAADLCGRTLPALIAADWAERSLPKWESLYPDDRRPHEAIAAARAWAECPCDSCRGTALSAAEALRPISASSSPDLPAWDTADWDAAKSAENSRFAVYATSANPDKASRCAAMSSRTTMEPDDAEREWQRMRLAHYVLTFPLQQERRVQRLRYPQKGITIPGLPKSLRPRRRAPG